MGALSISRHPGEQILIGFPGDPVPELTVTVERIVTRGGVVLSAQLSVQDRDHPGRAWPVDVVSGPGAQPLVLDDDPNITMEICAPDGGSRGKVKLRITAPPELLVTRGPWQQYGEGSQDGRGEGHRPQAEPPDRVGAAPQD